ncbi:MAG: hypothetical protein DME34_02880 [Verrucomicrobia bacterium]|nr:MAG: hypothetical protein DME34_02880 [Verrucomicrobiota bacterium]
MRCRSCCVSELERSRTFLKPFLAVAVMIAGGLVFAGDPAQFASLSRCGLAGTTVLAGSLFFVGLALWLQE